MGKYAIVDLEKYKLLIEDYRKHFTSDDVKRLEYDVTTISLSEEETSGIFQTVYDAGYNHGVEMADGCGAYTESFEEVKKQL